MTMKRLARPRRDGVAAVTAQQRFELILGPGGRPSLFASERARRSAWECHRESITERRPWAWGARRYDSAPPPPWYAPGEYDSATDF